DEVSSTFSDFQCCKNLRLGFNIVGGSDSPHIPGHSGIFVSIIKPGSPAYNDGRLSVGDLILAVSVNGIDLVNKTHDEVVSIFRSQTGLPYIAALVRMHGASLRDWSTLGSLSFIYYLAYHISFSPGNGFPHPNPLPSYVNDLKSREEDNDSPSSCAQSVHSYLDDVPRTPKRPMSYLDPRNPSLVTEALYVSIGLAVISLGVYVAYRVIRGRR
uniref:PDZ domain-containing protein n=1 Tax=Angiostrongylus cantonensis TaxID=6313 RepID=A0A0K0DDP5_ANGCA